MLDEQGVHPLTHGHSGSAELSTAVAQGPDALPAAIIPLWSSLSCRFSRAARTGGGKG